MCYPKPGPRCSRHAAQYLEKAQNKFKKDPSEAHRKELASAIEEYKLSPEGIKEMREGGDEEKARLYQERRKHRIAMHKMVQSRKQEFPDTERLARSGSGDVQGRKVQDFLEKSEELSDWYEIPNATNIGDEYIVIQDCQDPEIAMDNCMGVSSALSRQLDVPEIGVKFKGKDYAIHFANFVDGVVVDYTARQFGEDMPFPLVAPVDEWKRIITTAADNDICDMRIGYNASEDAMIWSGYLIEQIMNRH